MRGGWRPALRIARRSIRRNLGRSILIAALIAIQIAGATVMDGLLSTLNGPEHMVYQIMGDADGTAQVSDADTLRNWQPGATPDSGTHARNPATVDLASLLPRGSRVVPDDMSAPELRLTQGDHVVRTNLDLVAVGDPLTRHEARVESGRAPARPGEAMVTRALAERLGLLDGDRIRRGTTITADGGPTATVTGLALSPLATAEDAVVAPPDSVFTKVPHLDRYDDGTLNYLVDLPDSADPDAVWRKLAEHGVAFTPRAAYTDPARYPLMYAGDDTFGTLGPIALVVGIGVLEVVLLAGAAFAVGARRQGRELGLLAANGGTGKHVGRTVLAQGLVLGVVGAVGGLLIGVLLIFAGWRFWAGDEIVDSWHFGWPELVAAGVVGALSGLVAAVLPAINVARMRPVDALAQRFRGTARSARRPVVGLVLLVVGIVGALASGVAARQRLVTYGDNPDPSNPAAQPDLGPEALRVLVTGLVAVIGLIMVTSWLVAWLGRGVARLPLSGRLAVRDAGRHRHRTVPAVAAIMIVVAGSVLMAFLFAADAAGNLKHSPDDTFTVRADSLLSADPADPADAAQTRRDLDDGTRAMAAGLPEGSAVPMPVAQQLGTTVTLATDPQGRCGGGDVGIADPAALELALGHQPDSGVLADLASGKAIVLDDCMLEDGVARSETYANGGLPARLPARYEPRPEGTMYNDLPGAFVSAKVAKENGWTTSVDVVAVRYSASATQTELDEAVTTAEDSGLQVTNLIDDEYEADLVNTALTVGAGLVTLLGVAVTVALSAAEGRSDLATLAAVGAQPRRRRTLAGAQALVISGVGTVLGLVLGTVLAFAAAPLSGEPAFAVPWSNLAVTVLGVPALAVIVAMLVTRSRLPLVRRAE